MVFSHILRLLTACHLLGLISITTCFALSADEIDALRLNQIQVIGSHNSFKRAIDPKLYDLMITAVPKAKGLDYAHPPLKDQLNLGLRNLELDIYHDPEGGKYAKPLGLAMVRLAGHEPQPFDPFGKMNAPGFKVLHVQDIDFRSSCLTLADALAEIHRWSDSHPRHLPVMITFNVKDSTIELPGAVEPLKFDREAFAALDSTLISGLGKHKLIVPDDVRGEHPTLEAAVLGSNWPTLADARGKFLLVLDQMGRSREVYLKGHEGLRGRAMFVNSRAGEPQAAVMILNDPVRDEQAIAKFVRQGYLVRTRADAELREARAGDYSRFEAAKRSGAQVISTDFYLADRRIHSSYRIRFDDEGCCRLNPVNGPKLQAGSGDLPLE